MSHGRRGRSVSTILPLSQKVFLGSAGGSLVALRGFIDLSPSCLLPALRGAVALSSVAGTTHGAQTPARIAGKESLAVPCHRPPPGRQLRHVAHLTSFGFSFRPYDARYLVPEARQSQCAGDTERARLRGMISKLEERDTGGVRLDHRINALVSPYR